MGLIFALGSMISFSLASIYFSKFGQKLGPFWMNYFKAAVAFIGFGIINLFLGSEFNLSQDSLIKLSLSGLIGLTVGDVFLIKAFMTLGSGRALMIFGFSPLFLAMGGYLFLGETLKWNQILAVGFLMCCLFSFSWEAKKTKGHWELTGLICALLGVLCDCVGVILTRQAMGESAQISIFEVNFVRTGIAVIFFSICRVLFFFIQTMMKAKDRTHFIGAGRDFTGSLLQQQYFTSRALSAIENKFRVKLFFIDFLEQTKVIKKLWTLSIKDRREIFIASLFGTFLSLSFYMKAVQIGPIATVSAVAGTSPLFSTLIEVLTGRKKVSRQLILAIVCFLSGFLLLIRS